MHKKLTIKIFIYYFLTLKTQVHIIHWVRCMKAGSLSSTMWSPVETKEPTLVLCAVERGRRHAVKYN